MLSAIFLLSALRFKILTSPFHYVLTSLKIARMVTLFTFLWIIDALQHRENFRKKKKKKIIKRDMFKIYLPITYPVWFAFNFTVETRLKYIIYIFFLNQWLELNLLCLGSYSKWFCMKPWQKLTNLLLCKAPSQNFPAERRQKHSTNKVIPKQAQSKPIFDK